MESYELLMLYLENSPEIKTEIESIFIMAKLNDYLVEVNCHITDHDDAFFCNFFLKGQEVVRLDLVFGVGTKLKNICTCKGNKIQECNKVEFCCNSCALNQIKELLFGGE